MSSDRIYLDHAATSWPKGACVLDAMDSYARDCGAAAGRGHYRSAVKADAVLTSLRHQIARRIVAPSADCISLHPSGTAALNAAIHGLVRDGDHVVTTAAEHNSVLRPLHFLQQHHAVELTIIDCDRDGRVNAADVLTAVSDRTRLVVVTHASNVTGAIQPIEAIAASLRTHKALLLCDAAQTFGYLPIDVTAMEVDLLAAPGHKGGRGPLGTGLLYASPSCHELIRPSIQGGTGSQSESLDMPRDYPAKLEAGNMNVAALAGWEAGLRRAESVESTAGRGRELAIQLHHGLRRIQDLRVIGQPGELPIASVCAPHLGPIDMATILDVEYGIETRAGLHCAALIHRHLGSLPDGTLRISGGATTTHQQIDAVVEAISSVLQQISAHPT
jgi:cysteine desulfurase/selenocysteine lyase